MSRTSNPDSEVLIACNHKYRWFLFLLLLLLFSLWEKLILYVQSLHMLNLSDITSKFCNITMFISAAYRICKYMACFHTKFHMLSINGSLSP
jgi:hypothetical protein